MFVTLAGLSALNTFLNEQRQDLPAGKELYYKAVVIGEDQNDNRMKLRLVINSVIANRDTVPLSLNAVHNTFKIDNYLGKIITIKGRLILAKKIHQPNVIVGSIIASEDYYGFAGKLVNNANGYINNLFQNSLSSDCAPIAKGLVLGGSSRLNESLKTVFARAGVLHILAVSGLHIGFIITFLGTILIFLPISPKLKFSLIMLTLLFYAALTGFRPSVLRASLMAFFFGLSFLMQREVDAIHIVNMTCLIFVLLYPGMLFDIGAQLSFAAVYGIIYALPRLNTIFLKNIKMGLFRPIFWAMAVSFSAQIFVSPFLIHYFNQLPTLAIFSNLLIVPLASVVIYLLFILIIFSFFFAPAVNFISFFISQLIWLLKEIAGLFAYLPFSTISLNMPPIFLILFFLMFNNKMRKWTIFTACALAIFFSVGSFYSVPLIKITNNAAYINLPGQINILVCDKNNKILPDDFYKTRVNYLVAAKRITEVKDDFIPLPGRFQTKDLKFGNFLIHLDNKIIIQYQDFVIRLPDNMQDNLIKYIVCGKKGIYQFDIPAEASVLDRIIADFQLHFGVLKVNL